MQSLNINTGDRISFGSLTGKRNFEFNISTTLEVKKEYFVRTFVKTANHVVYGQVLSFMSLGSEAPTVTGFEPKTCLTKLFIFISFLYFPCSHNSYGNNHNLYTKYYTLIHILFNNYVLYFNHHLLRWCCFE